MCRLRRSRDHRDRRPTCSAAHRSADSATLLARELDATGVSGAIAVARNVLGPPVYVTVDIDVLDPAFAPGTGTPEAGGLTSRELLAIVRGLAGLDVVAADVVEVSPAYGPAGATAVAAANVACDLIGVMALAAVKSGADRGHAGAHDTTTGRGFHGS